MAGDILKVTGINSKGYGSIPKLPMLDRNLTPEAKCIYAYFSSFAGAGNSAFPNVSKIIYDLCMSESRYYKHFKLLVLHGYITVEQVKDKGRFSHNIYVLNTEIAPSTCFEGTENERTEKPSTENVGTNNNTLNINSFKNNNIKRHKNIGSKKPKDKYEKFYL
jgi:hypothetical protein